MARVFGKPYQIFVFLRIRGRDAFGHVLICRGPLGAGMEEVYQITSALKYMPYANSVALLLTPVSQACRAALHRARRPGGARGWSHRQSPRRRSDPRHH
jgi:hypothetical protein